VSSVQPTHKRPGQRTIADDGALFPKAQESRTALSRSRASIVPPTAQKDPRTAEPASIPRTFNAIKAGGLRRRVRDPRRPSRRGTQWRSSELNKESRQTATRVHSPSLSSCCLSAVCSSPQAPMYLTLDGTSSYDRRFIVVTCH
jgi:hypothetical protein